jgi:hypothetical protein
MAAAIALIVGGYVAVRAGLYASEDRQRSQIAAIGTLTVEYVVNPADARWRAERFGEDFDVTSSATVILKNGRYLYEIGQPFEKELFSPVKVNGATPGSFAVDHDDTLLTVAGGYFGMLGESGKTVDAVPLPLDNMRLAHSALDGVIYLYGGAESDYRLYSFAENGAFRILLQLEEPITAVTDNQQSVYVATGARIFRLRDGKVSQLLNTGGPNSAGPISSVAVTPGDDVVFFSAGARVYAMRGAGALSIVNNSGGALRLRGETLYVLDYDRGLVYTLSPATRKLFEEGNS